LIAEGTTTMALVREAESLLGHEIGEHGWGRSELGSHVTLLYMLAAKVDTHVDMASSGLVGRMQRHGNCTFVVAEEQRGKGLAETQIAEEEAQVQSFFSTLRQRVVLRLLRAQADCGAELHLPATGRAIEEKEICTCGFPVIKIGRPIAVCVAVQAVDALSIRGPKSKAEVLCEYQIFGDAMVSEPKFLARVVNISAQDADSMG